MSKVEIVRKADYLIPGIRDEFLAEVLGTILAMAMRDVEYDQTTAVALALKRAFYTGFKSGQSCSNTNH